MTLALAPYVTIVLLLYGLTYYRLNKKFKNEPVKAWRDFFDRNPVEAGYLLGIVTCSVMIWPGLAGLISAWLKYLLPGV